LENSGILCAINFIKGYVKLTKGSHVLRVFIAKIRKIGEVKKMVNNSNRISAMSGLKMLWKCRKSLCKDEKAGSVVEYALILGFGLLIFIALVAVVVSLVDFADVQVTKFLNSIGL